MPPGWPWPFSTEFVMLIGIDFDNTIVSYDELFYQVACEQNLIPTATAANKLAVRDYLRQAGQEQRWTELQGYVYGTRMDEAQPFPGLVAFMRQAGAAGHQLAIVSHKTRYPFLGPKYDLHAAARAWINHYLQDNGRPLVAENRVFFELTKVDKLTRISDLACELFIDDLPEILLTERFPAKTTRILFDPEQHHAAAIPAELRSFRCWDDVAEHLFAHKTRGS